jgi:hypothetical protein
MKSKKRILLTIFMLILGIIVSFSLADTERMETDAFNTLIRPAAVFSHDDHNEAAELEDDCAACHHVYDGKQLVADESSEDSPCSECHSLKSTPENSVPLSVAFHNRCKSCHFDTAKGPVLCGECHINKEGIK